MNLKKSELNTLYRYALALTQEEPRAFDLVHSALIKAFDKTPNNPVSYLRVSIRNLFFDEYRRNKSFEQVELSESSHEPVQLTSRSLEDVFIDSETVEQILGRLQPQDRELLYMYAVEEMTFEEIAAETGQKKGTLLSRMHRLREKLKKETEVKDEVIS